MLRFQLFSVDTFLGSFNLFFQHRHFLLRVNILILLLRNESHVYLPPEVPELPDDCQ